MSELTSPSVQHAPTLVPEVAAEALRVGGLTPFTATDFPGQLAAVVFVQGCPWACAYCHNPHLQSRAGPAALRWTELVGRLKRRIGLIDAVVFSGGEPTMDPALPAAIRTVRALGFKVGLHTAGCYPRRLAEVLPWLDWVGFDIKAAPPHYDRVTQTPDSARQVWRAAQMVLASGVAHEFRTTVHPTLHAPCELLPLAQSLRALGVRHYALQVFRGTGCADQTLVTASTADYPGAHILQGLAGLFEHFVVRRA